MRSIVLMIMLMCCSLFGFAQDIYVSRNANISFYSSAPIEDIQAETNQAVSAINLKTGSVYFKVFIKSFQFEKSLMQEHFNSDYLESDKFPFAEFKGKIISPATLNKDSSYPATVTGQLTIHGVTKDYNTPGTISLKDGKLTISSVFKVHLVDHHIAIPRLLIKNIAEVVDVKVNAVYSPDSTVDNPSKLSAKNG